MHHRRVGYPNHRHRCWSRLRWPDPGAARPDHSFLFCSCEVRQAVRRRIRPTTDAVQRYCQDVQERVFLAKRKAIIWAKSAGGSAPGSKLGEAQGLENVGVEDHRQGSPGARQVACGRQDRGAGAYHGGSAYWASLPGTCGAEKLRCGWVSIFVNPTEVGSKESSPAIPGPSSRTARRSKQRAWIWCSLLGGGDVSPGRQHLRRGGRP